MLLAIHQVSGFYLLNSSCPGGLTKMKAAIVNIVKGQALHDDGAGYVTNTATDFANTFLGIAAENVDNSGGSLGSKEVLVKMPLPTDIWSCPVDGNALVTQTVVGTLLDLGADSSHIAIDDTLTEGWVFQVTAIDASAEAQEGTTYGYVIGRLIMMGTQA